MNVQELLEFAVKTFEENSILEPRTDAEVLLAHSLSFKRYKLHTEYDYIVPQEKIKFFRKLVSKRAKNFPLSYLTGKKEFMGMDFKIKPGVFIPRQETEILVEKAYDIFVNYNTPNKINIVDIGCGSGNISVSLAKIIQLSPPHIRQKPVKITGIDKNISCVRCANLNSDINKVEVDLRFCHIDIFEPLLDTANLSDIDIIVSNPPYIKTDEIKELQKEIFLFEPHESLDGGKDGLDFYRKISKHSRLLLKDRGHMIFEIGHGQVMGIKKIFQMQNFLLKGIYKDYCGIDRVMAFEKV